MSATSWRPCTRAVLGTGPMYTYVRLGAAVLPCSSNSLPTFRRTLLTPSSELQCEPRDKAEQQFMRLVAGFPRRRLGFEARSGHVGFVMDEAVLGQVFSDFFGPPCQFSSHRLLQTRHHPSSGAGTVGQTVAYLPSGLCLVVPRSKNLH
jgi:hypothetical protein